MAAPLFAQTNPPVKLALIGESDDAAGAVDLLTAQLSGDSGIQLLERDEIEKVYHEQGLSEANRNDLQLGRVLGADGLLLLNIVTPTQPALTPTSGHTKQRITVRLIAVKPGVILMDGSLPWPPHDTTEWSKSAAAYLSSFLPKLSVAAEDAIPISVVNLRSVVQSSEAAQTEHQLKMLAIQRLSQEPRLFVLERQKMQLLTEENELKANASAFWNGSYLLEGVIDQNGFSRDTITIDARLTPPRGAQPILFKVSGSRANLPEVVNALAARVAELLNIHSNVTSWDAAAEASKYYDEANWALRWGMYDEAQAASESAWALGKRDLADALVRVRSYVADIPKVEAGNVQHFASMQDYFNKRPDPHYVHINDPPNPENLDRALYALGAYDEFCQNSPDGKPEVLSRPHWNDWHDSDWYQLGVDTLTAASQVLQQYWFQPRSQLPVDDKLADLRAVARSVAQFISECPSVHSGYFVGDRIANRDELSHTMQDNSNIFRCEVNWGCFWQERPEDAISLYRELMSSPVFCYIHGDFWSRNPNQPRLAAWNAADKRNIPSIWQSFVRELNDSTNTLLQMEAKALMKADATNNKEAKAAEAGWWSIVRSHREELVGNNVELFYLGWGFAYNPETDGMDQDYWQKTIPGRQTTSVFEQQKQYLANFTPYDFSSFTRLFQLQKFTPAQAAELKPLIAAYRSKMVATASGQKLFFAKSDAQFIGLFLGKPVDEILQSPPKPAISATPGWARPPAPAAATVSAAQEVVPAHILRVVRFIKIPSESIQSRDISANQIFAQRWTDGKLLFGVAYTKEIYTFGTNGDWKSTADLSRAAIAIFDPAGRRWDIVNCPGSHEGSVLAITLQNLNDDFILFHHHMYSSMDGSIKEFDFAQREWRQVLSNNGNNLFSVAGRLYSAGPDVILELSDGGTTRILASTRRVPAVTSLDSLQSFDSPQLYAGPDQSLCASIGNHVYRWDGSDWHEILNMDISRPPEIFDDSIIFRAIGRFGSDDRSSLWLWDKSQSEPKLCLSDKPKPHPGINNPASSNQRFPWLRQPAHQVQPTHPQWESLPDDYLTSSPVTVYNSNLYFFVDHADVTNSGPHWMAVEKNGYHAKLVCLARNSATPTVVPLNFDTTRGQPPLTALGKRIAPWLMFKSGALDVILQFSGDSLYLVARNTPGVWAIPISELDSAIAVQRKAADNPVQSINSKDSAPSFVGLSK